MEFNLVQTEYAEIKISYGGRWSRIRYTNSMGNVDYDGEFWSDIRVRRFLWETLLFIQVIVDSLILLLLREFMLLFFLSHNGYAMGANQKEENTLLITHKVDKIQGGNNLLWVHDLKWVDVI